MRRILPPWIDELNPEIPIRSAECENELLQNHGMVLSIHYEILGYLAFYLGHGLRCPIVASCTIDERNAWHWNASSVATVSSAFG